jgi:1,4-dihydroxy-2-naphthoate octaprenyltransferase
MSSEERTGSNYLRIIQPQLLVWVLLTYSIGVGLVKHQGGNLDWINILFGSLLGIFLILMRSYLSAFFDHPNSPTGSLHVDDPRYTLLKRMDRQTLLVIAMTLLTAGALDTVLLMFRNAINLSAVFILGLAFLISFFAATPPLQLDKRGYGEVGEAILICNLIPAMGYLLNEHSLHVLLIMLTLPITLLYLALKIVNSLETYAFDRTHRVQSMVVRLDWLRSMQAHNYLVLIAFLFVAVFALLGQPWSLTWPMFLPLLIGIFQIIQIQGIINGAPPRWKILKLTAAGTFVVMAYLVSFTLWIS